MLELHPCEGAPLRPMHQKGRLAVEAERALAAFDRSGERCSWVDVGSMGPAAPTKMAARFRDAAFRLGVPVRVNQRGTRIYLTREDS